MLPIGLSILSSSHTQLTLREHSRLYLHLFLKRQEAGHHAVVFSCEHTPGLLSEDQQRMSASIHLSLKPIISLSCLPMKTRLSGKKSGAEIIGMILGGISCLWEYAAFKSQGTVHRQNHQGMSWAASDHKDPCTFLTELPCLILSKFLGTWKGELSFHSSTLWLLQPLP